MFNSQKYNILIIEDEFINAEFIERVITELGHNIVGNVDDAEKAVAIVKTNPVDFVFMDINLNSEIDGIECAKLLNREKDIPIIYMTAISDTSTINSASETNIYGYLIKPFGAKDIESILSVAISRFFSLNRQEELIDLGNNYTYNLTNKTFKVKNNPVHLTNREISILYFLVLNINQNISYSSLIESVWAGKKVSLSTIRDAVLRLRNKLPRLKLDNIMGMGYCLSDA